MCLTLSSLTSELVSSWHRDLFIYCKFSFLAPIGQLFDLHYLHTLVLPTCNKLWPFYSLNLFLCLSLLNRWFSSNCAWWTIGDNWWKKFCIFVDINCAAIIDLPNLTLIWIYWKICHYLFYLMDLSWFWFGKKLNCVATWADLFNDLILQY